MTQALFERMPETFSSVNALNCSGVDSTGGGAREQLSARDHRNIEV